MSSNGSHDERYQFIVCEEKTYVFVLGVGANYNIIMKLVT